jgi:hypothetical protein
MFNQVPTGIVVGIIGNYEFQNIVALGPCAIEEDVPHPRKHAVSIRERVQGILEIE